MSQLVLAAAPLSRALRRTDRVLMTLLLGVLLLTMWSPAQAQESISIVFRGLWQIAPFLLLSVLVAAYAKAAGADQLIAQAFSGRLGLMILAAALFGALSPFCSCGVIPLIAALLAMGMPLSAVMAFWLASPVMDPEMFILTAATLGLPFALAKTGAAIGLGLFGGWATLALQRRGTFAAPLRAVTPMCGGNAVRDPRPARWQFWHEAARRSTFAEEARANGFFLLKWLTLAFLIESLMLVYVPAAEIGRWLGSDNLWAIPTAALVGAPAYLNGFAAIPTADALMALGMAPGAALAFMVAGGVTSIPAAIAVFALVKRPIFLWYLLLAFVGSTAAGTLYQLTV